LRTGGPAETAVGNIADQAGRQMSMKRPSRRNAFLLAMKIAKLPMVPSHILKEIPRQRHSFNRED
jgi:hypothetical protein